MEKKKLHEGVGERLIQHEVKPSAVFSSRAHHSAIFVIFKSGHLCLECSSTGADLEIFRGVSGSLELQLQPSCKLKTKKEKVTTVGPRLSGPCGTKHSSYLWLIRIFESTSRNTIN